MHVQKIPPNAGDMVLVTFVWGTQDGNCKECPCPAAFIEVDAYGPGKHKPLCCVCAANSAADGNEIKRTPALNGEA